MWCLIAAESAIFSIFVVAYLVLRGKESQWPDAARSSPHPVFQLDLPVLQQLYHCDGGARHRTGQRQDLRHLVVPDHRPGRDLHPGHRPGVVRPDLPRRPDRSAPTCSELRYYSLVGLHAFHVIVGLTGLSIIMIFTASGAREAGARRTYRRLRHVLALCGRNMGCGTFGGVFHYALKRTKGPYGKSAQINTRRIRSAGTIRHARTDCVALCLGAWGWH